MRLKKIVTRAGIIIISFALVILIAFIGLWIYIRKNIKHSVDEELFVSSSKSSVSTFYAYTSTGDIEQIWQTEGNGKKMICSLDRMGEHLINAVISAEDRMFYTHKGVNIKRTGAAMLNHIFKFKSDFGGSTITQQVIKNISGDNEFTVRRKINEIVRAIYLERHHTKNEILELYLNIVPMTDNIYGVKMAANTYFDKEPDELSLSEAATIIGITNSPALYNPYKHPQSCKKKRNRILYAMYDNGRITEGEYKDAIAEPLLVENKKNEQKGVSSWFIETVTEDIVKDLTKKQGVTERAARIMFSGGMKIYTTMNVDVQRILDEYFSNPENMPEEIARGLQCSMSVTDPYTGNLLGIIGGAGPKSGNRILNYATVPRMPGSSLKPIALYAPLLNSGKVRWSSVFDDTPVTYVDGRPYPKNSPDIYRGLTNLNDALRMSKNTVAVRLYELLGARKIYDILSKDYGIDTLVEKEQNSSGKTITDLAMAPLALGQLCHGVSIRKLTECYSVFPAEGVLCGGKSYYSVVDSAGRALLINENSKKRIISVECAKIMNQMLMNVTFDGTARSLTIKNMVDTAGKTGTSGSDMDKTFVGYTPYLVAGIWMGYPDGTRCVGSVSKNHLQIWDQVMKEIHENVVFGRYSDDIKGFSTDGIEYLPYCYDSGCLYTQVCQLDPRGDRLSFGYFSPGNTPEGECKTHILCQLYDDEEFDNKMSIVALLNLVRDLPEDVVVSDSKYVYSESNAKVQERETKEEYHIEPEKSYDFSEKKRKRTR